MSEEKIIRFHPDVEKEVLQTLARYCQSLLRDGRRTVQLEERKEVSISDLLGELEALQHFEKMPSWWPSLCEALLKDAVESILAGIKDVPVTIKEILQEDDPIAAAYRIRKKRLEEMEIEDLDLGYGEDIYTAAEVIEAVCRKKGIGNLVRHNHLFAAAIRRLPRVS